MSTLFLVIITILVIGTFIGFAAVRNALFKKASTNVIKDSAVPPKILGKPSDYGICEEPRILCKDPGRGTTPDPAAGMWALVGVRPDRFVTRNAVYYSGSGCTGDVYLAPPAAPLPWGDLTPDLPVGYLDGLETVGQLSPLSYGVGAPSGFVFGPPQTPTGPGLLYRSADEPISTRLINSVWTSLAPDCVLEPLPGGAAADLCIIPPSGMVGWWPGDGTESDIQGTNPGDNTGGATFAPGQVGDAFLFDGSSYVEVPHAPELNVGSFTLDAWVYPESANGVANIIVNKERNPPAPFFEYEIAVRGTAPCSAPTIPFGHFVFSMTMSPGSQPATGCNGWHNGSTGALPLNDWSHVALTYDAITDTVRTYVDGTLQVTLGGFTGTVLQTTGALRIGARTVGFPVNSFDGQIDEVELFSRALTPAEVAAIYAAGADGKCKAASAESYSLTDEFSILNGNPNGVWTYGRYTGGLDKSTFSTFPLAQTLSGPPLDGAGSLEYWRDNPSIDPNIIKNVGPTDTCSSCSGITFNGGAVTFGPFQGPAVARFTAPSSGSWQVDATFATVQVGNSTPSAWVHNGASGDTVFDLVSAAVQAFPNNDSYSQLLALAAGDTVDVVVWGSNTNNKTTEVSATITKQAEAATGGAGGEFPDALCENIAPITLSLIRAEEVVDSAGDNLLEIYTPPFNIMPAMVGDVPATSEGVVVMPPDPTVPATPEGN